MISLTYSSLFVLYGSLGYINIFGTIFLRPSMDILTNAAEMLPDGLPFASEIKTISRALASESPGNKQMFFGLFSFIQCIL